jgi:hypothetical protein
MNLNPEQGMLAICLITAAVSAVFATIERLHGLGPGAMRHSGMPKQIGRVQHNAG